MLEEELSESEDDEDEEVVDDYSDVPKEEMDKMNKVFDDNLRPLVPEPKNDTCS